LVEKRSGATAPVPAAALGESGAERGAVDRVGGERDGEERVTRLGERRVDRRHLAAATR
jgi:hypothetical protein